jgi:SAM-dependent methyltransferase
MVSSKIQKTIASYDRDAACFAARWGDLRLERALSAFAGRVAGRRLVLDLGCGPGRDVDFLGRLGCRVVGLDLSAGMLAQARSRLPGGAFVQADLRRLPFAAGCLDGIWACASLLHLPGEQFAAALADLARLLRRPVGLLYLSLKGGRGERWVSGPEGQPYFFAYYQPIQVEPALKRAGFRLLDFWLDADQAGRDEPWLNYLAGI